MLAKAIATTATVALAFSNLAPTTLAHGNLLDEGCNPRAALSKRQLVTSGEGAGPSGSGGASAAKCEHRLSGNDVYSASTEHLRRPLHNITFSPVTQIRAIRTHASCPTVAAQTPTLREIWISRMFPCSSR